MHTSHFSVVEGLPCGFACLVHMLLLVAGLDVLVVKNTWEFPNFITGLVGFNVVNDVIVGNNLFMLIVDEALKLDSLWLKFKIILSEGIINHLDNLGVIASTIILCWHEDGVIN